MQRKLSVKPCGPQNRRDSGRDHVMRAAIVAFCLLLIGASSPQAQEAAAPPVAVAAAPATVGPVPVEVAANGTAQAVSIISVRSRVDGQVERVHVQEGQMVKA